MERSVCLPVDVGCLKLGIYDLLTAVEPVVAGEHIA